ncbi:MAG: hypothetical protein M1829_002256 [Trizodia sp. TS-e1964]|nr:MAG: hypothetical protein M1829_002256 [Trizodia sp. TS-e1964]
MHSPTLIAFLAPFLSGLASTTPTPTRTNAGAVLAPRAVSWPSPTPPAGSVAYDAKIWPQNVVPQVEYADKLSISEIPAFIAQQDSGERIESVVVIYAVVKANPPDRQGNVLHTLAIVAQRYGSMEGGWWIDGESTFHEALPNGGNKVAWKKIGMATSLASVGMALRKVPVPETRLTSLLPRELQYVRTKWFAQALSPSNVLPQVKYTEKFFIGDIPAFIPQLDSGERIERPVVIYVVIKERPADEQGIVAHTLAIVLQKYVSSVEGGWASKETASLYEAVARAEERKIVAWWKIGLAINLAGVGRTINEVPEPEADYSTAEVQRVRTEWFEQVYAMLKMGHWALHQLD